MPVPLALAVPAAIGLGKSIYGGIQSSRAKKDIEELERGRPKLKRTAASREKEALARNLAGTTRLPGQAAIESGIGAATSRGVEQAKQIGGSASDIIGATTALAGQEQAGLQQLGVQGAQMQRGAQANLQGVLGDVSEEQYAQQEYNVLAPWREKFREAKEQRAEGRKMLGGGLTDIGSALSLSDLSIGGGGSPATGSALSRRKGGIVGL